MVTFESGRRVHKEPHTARLTRLMETANCYNVKNFNGKKVYNMAYKRKTGRKYKRATQVNHKVLKAIGTGLTLYSVYLPLRILRHKKPERVSYG